MPAFAFRGLLCPFATKVPVRDLLKGPPFKGSAMMCEVLEIKGLPLREAGCGI
jgi:hypothetical protein